MTTPLWILLLTGAIIGLCAMTISIRMTKAIETASPNWQMPTLFSDNPFLAFIGAFLSITLVNAHNLAVSVGIAALFLIIAGYCLFKILRSSPPMKFMQLTAVNTVLFVLWLLLLVYIASKRIGAY